MINGFEIWKFLAGLGIFLFGMFLLEEAIRQISGRAFKRLIKRATAGRLRAIITGAFSTAVLQSSSAVSLITLAFAGAGILSMQNAIGVIFGTNIGTTFTGWIITTIGFKINIEGIFLPLIGIGGLGLILLSRSNRYSGISKLLVGFGFLFMGLDYMKLSVEQFTQGIDLATIPHYGIWFYVLLGIVLTAMMQSSSATLAIILTALNGGVIFFGEAAAMVIGANIGTTVTVLMGSIGAGQIKKQIAFSHLIFNLGTGVAALAILPLFIRSSKLLPVAAQDELFGIALFHSVFNFVGLLIFFPFIGHLSRLLQRWFPERRLPVTLYIRRVSQDLPEAAIHALEQEVHHLFAESLIFFATMFDPQRKTRESRMFLEADANKEAVSFRSPDDQLVFSLELQKSIVLYASNISHGDIEPFEKDRIHRLIHVAMLLAQVNRTLSGVGQELEELENSSNSSARESYKSLRSAVLQYVYQLLSIIADENRIYAEIKLPSSLAALGKDAEEFVAEIAGKLESRAIEEKHATSLLAVSGLIVQTSRQLNEVAAELLLSSARSGADVTAEAITT
jgi:phosphate:Na+ symporter